MTAYAYSDGLEGICCYFFRGTRAKQASDENRLLGTAFQNYKQESDSRLLRAQRLADEQRNSIDTLQRQNQYLAEEMKYKEEQISKQVYACSCTPYAGFKISAKFAMRTLSDAFAHDVPGTRYISARGKMQGKPEPASSAHVTIGQARPFYVVCYGTWSSSCLRGHCATVLSH